MHSIKPLLIHQPNHAIVFFVPKRFICFLSKKVYSKFERSDYFMKKKQRIISFMIALTLCLSVLSVIPTKTEAAEKYNIRTVADLKKMSKYPNAEFYLKKNLNLENKEWKPIGTEEKPFTGKFYGNGYTIKNLKITKTSKYAGLFGYTSGAEISNLCVTGEVKNVECYGGGIIGLADKGSIISYCISKVKVSGMDQIGGVVGCISDSEAEYCINYKTVNATGRASGGITADLYPSGNIVNCLNMGDVKGGNDLTGGITGGSTAGNISGSIVLGNVSSGSGRIGVIAGDNASYAGSRKSNYFLQTDNINFGFESVEGRTAITSSDDPMVKDILQAVGKKIK